MERQPSRATFCPSADTTTGSHSTSRPFDVFAFGCSLTSTHQRAHDLVERWRGDAHAARVRGDRVQQVAGHQRPPRPAAPGLGTSFSAGCGKSRTSRAATSQGVLL